MRILVTGASGFVGRVTARYLIEQGHQVVGLSRSRSELPAGVIPLIGPLDNQRQLGTALVAQQSFDAVVHLAAASTVRDSFTDPARTYATNIGGTANLLAAIDRHSGPVALVFTSTCAIYGPHTEDPLSEDIHPDPSSPYASSKLAAEDLVRYAAAAGKVGAMVLRLFNVAGADRGVVDTSSTRIIGNAVRAAAGLLPHVTVNGDGSAVREFTHVTDVATAILLAIQTAETGQAETMNIGTGQGVSMAQVIAKVAEVTGHPVPVEHRPPVNEPRALVADVARAGKVLRWEPTHSSLDQIVADTWKYRDLLA